MSSTSRRYIVNSTLIPLTLLAQQPLLAESGDSTSGTIVVTATRTAKVESEAPASVTVVTEQEIKNKHAHRLDEALQGTPGVFIRGLDGEQPSNWQNQITLRGVPGYYRTGVLLDGIPLNNAFSAGVNMSIVPMDEIQQIEVVPGPFSSLYGGAGMSGVINIITKAPEKRDLNARTELGSHDFRSLTLGYRDRFENGVGLSLSYGHKEADGYVKEYVKKTPSGSGGTPVTGWEQVGTPTGGTTYIVGDKGEQPWEVDNFSARLYLTLSEVSQLILSASYLETESKPTLGSSYLRAGGVPFTSGSAEIDGSSTTIRATDFARTSNGEDVTRYSLNYERDLANGGDLSASLSYQDNAYWYTSVSSNLTDTEGAGKVSDIPANSLYADVHVGLPLGESHYLVLGLSGNRDRLNKKVYALDNWTEQDDKGALGDYANGKSRLVALYAQDEFMLTPRLTAYLGARYDRWSTEGDIFISNALNHYNSRSRSAFSPKLSLVYDLSAATVIKGAVGRAFRAPNLSDMYSSFGSSTIYWSNPDLEPEKVTSAELSVEHRLSRATKLRATTYVSRYSDLIYTTTSGSDRTKLNAGKADTEGLDLELRHALTPSISSFINATWVNTEITDNNVRPESEGKQIPLQARQLANVGLEGAYGPWSGSVIGTYTGKMYSRDDNSDTESGVPGSYDAYFKVNTKIGYRFNDNWSADLSIKNLLDREYYQGNYLADERSYYLGLSARF
ncbi:MAG: TonB-dependent receptor [Candidatus Thiodiazotropha sp.]